MNFLHFFRKNNDREKQIRADLMIDFLLKSLEKLNNIKLFNGAIIYLLRRFYVQSVITVID